jgi:hypothetical protein
MTIDVFYSKNKWRSEIPCIDVASKSWMMDVVSYADAYMWAYEMRIRANIPR